MPGNSNPFKRGTTTYDWIALSPLALFVAAFTVGPIIKVFLLCFTYEGAFPSWHNLAYIFSHYRFYSALKNTFFIFVFGLSVEICLGFVLALMLTSKVRAKRFLRLLILLPLGIPTIIVAANMCQLFDSHGLLNKVLLKLHILDTGIDWIASPTLATVATISADMWKVTPLVMLIFAAGIEAIPQDVVKAAKIDGASYSQIVRKIYLPLLTPALNMAIVIRGIDCFRIFELPLTMFGRSFPVLSSYAYFEYIEGLNPYTSSAASVILLLMIALSFGTYFFWLRKRGAAYV